MLSFFGGIALLSQWLLSVVEEQLTPSPAESVPSLFLEEFTAVRRHPNGQPQLVLMAPHLQQLANTEGMEIEQPLMLGYDLAGQRLWLLRARQAWISHDQARIELMGEVRAVRFPHANQTALVLHTEAVTIEPPHQRIFSEQFAQLFTPQGQTTAVGFLADLAQHRLELRTVRGEYVP